MVNALEELELTDGTVLDYVRYFLFSMRGDQGAFVLIESPEEITAIEGAAPPEPTRLRRLSRAYAASGFHCAWTA